jgi:hypothetical protein
MNAYKRKRASNGSLVGLTDADLAETIEVKFTPAIQAKAAELGNDPRKIYEWVRNNVEFVPTYGSIQGADYCLQTLQCNAFDTSSLLIALLRVSGVHARYAKGTVQMPVSKFTNWVGGFTNSTAALDFAASGGIPTTGLVEAGAIKAMRLEHVWVEAWVDMIPSMGAIHRQGDTWVPLDASFKQYTYTDGMDISAEVPFDGSAFIDSAVNSGTYSEAESYISDIDASFINSTLSNHQEQTVAFINQTNPNPSMDDVYGGRNVVARHFPILMGTLPFKTKAVHVRYSELPESQRHKVQITVSSDGASVLSDPVTVTLNMPEVVGKKLSLSYIPATNEDNNIRKSYLGEPSLPVYLVNVKTEISLENAPLVTGAAMPMGISQQLSVALISPSSTNRITHALRAGDYAVIGLNTGMLGIDIDQKIQDVEVSNSEEIISETLYQSILGYWMQNDMLSDSYARTFDINAVRFPSEGIATAPIDVEYSFGVPVSGSYGAIAFDIKSDLMLIKAKDGNNDRKVKYNIVTGMIGSALEGAIFDQLFPEDTEVGISAIKLLTVALQGGIKVYGIDKSNIDTIIPKLQVDATVISEVRNAVNAGSIVIMPESTMTHAGWSGDSYIILDSHGNGGYMLSSGEAGGRKLLATLSSFPAMNKPATKGMQDSFQDWLTKKGISYSKLIEACPIGGLCGNGDTAYNDNPIKTKQSQFEIASILNMILGFFVAEAEAEPCSIGIAVTVAGLAALSILAAMISKMGTDIYTDSRSRVKTSDWHSYIHYTDCIAAISIEKSELMWPSIPEFPFGFGFGVYMTDDSLLYLLPEEPNTIVQYLEMGDKVVETYIELDINEEEVWVTHDVNSHGQNEYIARVLYLNLHYPDEVNATFHFEYCNR